MGTISLKILKKEQYEAVVAILEGLEKKQIIWLDLPEENSMAVPGEPVSDKELLKNFEEAEQSELESGEEARQVFKVIKGRGEK